MTPEAEKWFEGLSGELRRRNGIDDVSLGDLSTSPKTAETLSSQISDLVNNGYFYEASELAQELGVEASALADTESRRQELLAKRQEFDQLYSLFLDGLNRLGMADTDIPEGFLQPETEEPKGDRETGIGTIQDAFMQFFKTDEQGYFIRPNISTVIGIMVDPALQRDPVAIKKAKGSFYPTRTQIIGLFKHITDEYPDILLEQVLDNPQYKFYGYSREHWMEFYRKVADRYPGITVDEFIKIILPKKGEPEQYGVSDLMANLDVLKPYQLVHYREAEMVLCRFLCDEDKLAAIEQDVLGKGLNDAAAEVGWNEDVSCTDATKDAQEILVEQRRNSMADPDEDYSLNLYEQELAVQTIIAVINRSMEDPDKWRLANYPVKDLYGFKTLSVIVSQIDGDKSKANKLLSILFPRLIFTTDEQGFIIDTKRQ